MLEVVAALIARDDKYLICRRAAHKSNGGLWEFPGGKIEAGESPEQALFRECAEELAVQLQVGRLLLQTQHRYPHAEISLSLLDDSFVCGRAVAHLHYGHSGITVANEFGSCLFKNGKGKHGGAG